MLIKLVNNHKKLLALRNILKSQCEKKVQAKFISTKSEEVFESHEVSTPLLFHGNWPEDERKNFTKDMQVIPSFITEDEERQILDEIEPYLKRLRYEFDHWDDAIHGYRETERKNWYPNNRAVLERVKKVAFNSDVMPYVHVLDLAENGVIKPHVDSTRYCGTTIAGLSLLSDCIMRLVRTDEKKYQQKTDDDNYRDQSTDSDEFQKKHNFYADILLNRRSLYIMTNSARYNFTHEILSKELSQFNGKQIDKKRRISIICRNEP